MKAAVLSLSLLVGASAAADPLVMPLPTLALDPAPAPSVWSGLYVGSELVGISRSGGRGGFGGDAYAGYSHAYANRVLLDVQGGTGYAPTFWTRSGMDGVDYGVARARVGYDLGRLVPFVTADVALERPHLGPGAGFGSETINTLLNGRGGTEAAGSVGVGAVYAVTGNLSVGVALSAGAGHRALASW